MLIGVLAEETLLPLSTKPSLVFDGGAFGQIFKGDIFFQHRIYIIGFVAPNLVDETAPLDAENFPTTYVTNGYNGIFPDLISDPYEIFYAPSRSSVPAIAPQTFFDLDRFYGPTIPFNPPLYPTIRYIDTDGFFVPSINRGYTLSLVIDNDIVRASIIRRDGDPFTLLPELFSDADVIFTPAMASGLSPGLFNASDIIYTVAQIISLFPNVVGADDTILSLTIASAFNPGLVIDTDIFLGPELRRPGNMGLVVDDDVIRAPSINYAPLLASLVADTDVFFSPAVAEAVMVPLDPIVDFDDTFYVPNVIIFQALTPHLWPDVDIFFSVPSVALGQPLFPALFNEGDGFFAPVATLVPVLFPILFADSDVFFTPTVKFDQFLVQQFTAVDTDNFYSPSITALAGWDGALAADGPIMPSTRQPTVIYIEG